MSVITARNDLEIEISTTLQLCRTINTVRSLTVYLLIQNREWDQYLSLSIDANNYFESYDLKLDLLVTKILSKSPNLPTKIDKKQVAITAFEQSESLCRDVNQKFASLPPVSLPTYIWDMQQLIKQILPPLTEARLTQIIELCSHGPGATTGVRGNGSTVADKYQKALELTVNLIPFAKSIMGDNWFNNNRIMKKIVNGSRFVTVPKNAKTDRGICIEPTLNMFLQKGIGTYIRQRLKSFSLNLDYQADKNRISAKNAYKLHLATIDLEAASDSISTRMVECLLPPDWFHLLMIARSATTTIDRRECNLQKISSMGNGFTFELESLIFFALCKSVVSKKNLEHVNVFGDDIIVHQSDVKVVIEALNFLGFRVNRSKSFLDGCFFESCGTDWFKGSPVRPFYLKGSSEGIPYTVTIANRLRAWCSDSFSGCDPLYKDLWRSLLRQSPKEWRQCRVPIELGDVGFTASEGELLSRKRPRDLWHEGFLIKTISFSPKKRRIKGFGVLLNQLARSCDPEVATYGFLPVRGHLGRTRTRWTLIQEWPTGLEWNE